MIRTDDIVSAKLCFIKFRVHRMFPPYVAPSPVIISCRLFHTDFIQKLSLIDPLMCVAVVALSLAILLLCFITFIAFYCPVAFVDS